MLVTDAVANIRSMMTGSMMDEISVLGAAYDPKTDSTITLKYPKRNLISGSVLSVGLNTFIALNISTDGQTIEVLPAFDGGPNVAAPINEIVRIRPQFTTYSIFREIVSEIQAMSSPDVGLFATLLLQSSGLNYVDGTYFIDPDDIPAGREILRLAKAEFKVGGTDAWQGFAEAEYQPSGGVIRVPSDPSWATEYAFTLATTFGVPTDLTTDLDATCGIPDAMVDIVMLGVCATLALGWEGRRTQPFAQGDPRRAGEVSIGSNSSLSRTFMAKQQKRVAEELARLTRLYGWRQAISTGRTTDIGWRGPR
ncbi:MAG: hypothetical protein AB7U23_12535 [Dehalococcoidia bacterium]